MTINIRSGALALTLVQGYWQCCRRLAFEKISAVGESCWNAQEMSWTSALVWADFNVHCKVLESRNSKTGSLGLWVLRVLRR